MEKQISIGGPVEEIDGQLMLRIPLEEGGADLYEYARAITTIEDGELIFIIQPWMAEKLRIGAGSRVIVDNLEGKFRVTRNDPD